MYDIVETNELSKDLHSGVLLDEINLHYIPEQLHLA